MVQQAKMLFPLSQIGAIAPQERRDIMSRSKVGGKYDKAVDRQSAYEDIERLRRTESKTTKAETPKKTATANKTKRSGGRSVLGSLLVAFGGTLVRKVANELAKSITGSKRR